MMKKSRRSFLKVAGIAAIGLGAAPAMNFAASDSHGTATAVKGKNHEALSAHRWGMVIDTNKLNEEVVEFKTLNPTAENIAVVIWNKLRSKIDKTLSYQ